MSLEQIQVTPIRRGRRILLRLQGGKAPSRLVDVTVSLDNKEAFTVVCSLIAAIQEIDPEAPPLYGSFG